MASAVVTLRDRSYIEKIAFMLEGSRFSDRFKVAMIRALTELERKKLTR